MVSHYDIVLSTILQRHCTTRSGTTGIDVFVTWAAKQITTGGDLTSIHFHSSGGWKSEIMIPAYWVLVRALFRVADC